MRISKIMGWNIFVGGRHKGERSALDDGNHRRGDMRRGRGGGLTDSGSSACLSSCLGTSRRSMKLCSSFLNAFIWALMRYSSSCSRILRESVGTRERRRSVEKLWRPA